MSWLDEFKVALVAEDYDTIGRLSKEVPDMNIDELRSAMTLMQTAMSEISKKQDQIKQELQKVQKAKKYGI
nr:hypothetical protein [Campylobacter sp.]